MVKRHLQSLEGSISVGLSRSEIHVAVQALDDARGELLLRLEVVDYKLLVLPDAPGELLDGCRRGRREAGA